MPGSLRFLLSGRWLWRHVMVLVLVAGCVTAGFWQIARLHEVRRHNSLVRTRRSGAPQPLEAVAPPGRPVDAARVAYRRVTVDGRYQPSGEVVLLGRELDGQTGNDLLTPLRLLDGRRLVVNRGWVPFATDRPGASSALPPAGQVRLTGVLFPSEVAPPGASGPRVPQFTRIDVSRLGRQDGEPVLPVYLWLRRQEPGQQGTLPRLVPLPSLSEGPHLNYAVQWFLFASVGMVGYPLVIRKELIRRRRE